MGIAPRIVYGTSGFRAKSDVLHVIVKRTAFFAALRARSLGQAVGLMITASHNPAEDNGIKLVDPNGQMLPIDCEEKLTNIVNTDDEKFAQYAQKAIDECVPDGKQVFVIIATDTRSSSPLLLSQAIIGVEMLSAKGVRTEIFERHTTPQLHFIVRAANDSNFANGYVTRFRDALTMSFKLIPFVDNSAYRNELFIDCANGVGALWVGKYLTDVQICSGVISDGNDAFLNRTNAVTLEKTKKIQMIKPVELHLLNTLTDSDKLLNCACGADFVKIHAQLPANFENVPIGARCVSLDGDADRLIYFYPTEDKKVALLDGDHIAALFARFIQQLFDDALKQNLPIPLSFGVIQTAYANGNSTRYFKGQLRIKPIMTKTGVKYLEEAAHNFDIGLYFEANGHGTVYFSQKFHDFILSFNPIESAPQFVQLLALFSQLVNELVGDGIADILAVECLLRYFDWSIQDWEKQTYTNMPSVQLKLPVADRTLYETVKNNETILIRPVCMQKQIDEIVAQFENARAFIRPSGTEQIVRVYAEAKSESEAHNLAAHLAKLIQPK